MRPSSYLWCDLFAVRQWPGNASDLAFGPIVARCPVFLLVDSLASGVLGAVTEGANKLPEGEAAKKLLMLVGVRPRSRPERSVAFAL